MPFFSKVFKSREPQAVASARKLDAASLLPSSAPLVLPPKAPQRVDAWFRTEVAPEEVELLLSLSSQQLKSIALHLPFVLLPFRPNSDSAPAKRFVRDYFRSRYDEDGEFEGRGLLQQLRLLDASALCSILRWCWSRIPGGVVTWRVYNLFATGERDSNLARRAFDTLMPLSVDSKAREHIICDFFDLLAALAAHGKSNGLGGRQLSRLAGWWAFDQRGTGKFDEGYRSWARAADATSHLFFAYLRSKSPDSSGTVTGINALPRSLQKLLSQTEYPPQRPANMQTWTYKILLTVSSASPTPHALLRRAQGFQYPEEDGILQRLSEFDDPVDALTDECSRVLNCISQAHQLISVTGSDTLPKSSSPDAVWSAFESQGFFASEGQSNERHAVSPTAQLEGARSDQRARDHASGKLGAPSWADFLSSGFGNEASSSEPAPLALPKDKPHAPLDRPASRLSQVRKRSDDQYHEPGELTDVSEIHLDDTFWWVWLTSWATEEPAARRAVFERCALVETRIAGGRRLIMEEQVHVASPIAEDGAHLLEKNQRLALTKRVKVSMSRAKSFRKGSLRGEEAPHDLIHGKDMTLDGRDLDRECHEKIQRAAAALAQAQLHGNPAPSSQRRGRKDEEDRNVSYDNANRPLTLQTHLAEAAPAFTWAKNFDKANVRTAHVSDPDAGRRQSGENLPAHSNVPAGSADPAARGVSLPSDSRRVPEHSRPDVLNVHEEPRTPTTDLGRTRPRPRPPLLATTTAALEKAFEAGRKPSGLGIFTHSIRGRTGNPHISRKPLPNTRKAPQDLSRQFDFGDIEQGFTKEKQNGFQAPLPESQKFGKSKSSAIKKLLSRRKVTRPVTARRPVLAETYSNTNSAQRWVSPSRKSISPKNSSHISQFPPRSPRSASSRSPHSRTGSFVAPPVPPMPPGEPLPQSVIDLSTHPSNDRDANRNDNQDIGYSFARFDQGPSDEEPDSTFIDNPDRESDAAEPRVSTSQFNTRAAALLSPETGERCLSPESIAFSADRASYDSLSALPHVSAVAAEHGKEVKTEPASYQERWVQIREAAEVRARSTSDSDHSEPKQSALSYTARPGSETSAEDTIEARVARIKARVAELTGNMESASTKRR